MDVRCEGSVLELYRAAVIREAKHYTSSLKKGETIPMRNKYEQLKKKGQGLVAYALILVLIAIVVILILTFLGTKVSIRMTTIAIRTRIRAYSTRPWPFFFNCSNLLRIGIVSPFFSDDV